MQDAHGVDAAVEGFVSDSLVFVPFTGGKSFDEFGADCFCGELFEVVFVVGDGEVAVAGAQGGDPDARVDGVFGGVDADDPDFGAFVFGTSGFPMEKYSHRDTEFAEFGLFLIKNSLLCVLRASAVQSSTPCTEIAPARLATGKPEERNLSTCHRKICARQEPNDHVTLTKQT